MVFVENGWKNGGNLKGKPILERPNFWTSMIMGGRVHPRICLVNCCLLWVGGWTNPFEQDMLVKLDHLPKNWGKNHKTYLKPPPCHWYDMVTKIWWSSEVFFVIRENHLGPSKISRSKQIENHVMKHIGFEKDEKISTAIILHGGNCQVYSIGFLTVLWRNCMSSPRAKLFHVLILIYYIAVASVQSSVLAFSTILQRLSLTSHCCIDETICRVVGNWCKRSHGMDCKLTKKGS